MARVTNFGDPSFEPTDEELAELMREAFADVEYLNPDDIARDRFGDWNSPEASLKAAR
jgi:hypothetical protein